MTTPTHPVRVRAAPTIVPAEQVPPQLGAVSFLSSVRRDGGWSLPRLFRLVAFWGNAELDLTRVHIGPGTSVVELRCIMGHVEITVPPEVRVEFEVEPLLASTEVRRYAESTAAPDAPVVRITGKAIAGAVEVNVVDPNAPGLLERIRRSITGA